MLEHIIMTWIKGVVVIAVAAVLLAIGGDGDQKAGKRPDLEAIDQEACDDDLVDVLEDHGRRR